MLTLKRLNEIFENSDWIVISKKLEPRFDGTYYIEIESTSPAGEDLVETVEINGDEEELIEELEEIFEDFDPDAHAETWIGQRGKNGVPGSIRAILRDADRIKDMLYTLITHVRLFLQKEKQERDEFSVTYMGIRFPRKFILDHLQEFEEMLRNSYSPYNGFIQQCNVSDILGEYCDQEKFRTVEQLLLCAYDDPDKVDSILLELKPDTPDADLVLKMWEEHKEEEV